MKLWGDRLSSFIKAAILGGFFLCYTYWKRKGVRSMLLPQQITAAIDELDEEQVKALLVEIFIARNYGNQEMIMKINEIAERLEMMKK